MKVLLDFNVDKSVYLIIGPKVARNSIENYLKRRPLTLSKQSQKIYAPEKFLGDVIDSAVLKRKGQVVKSIIECKAVIDDF